MNTETTTKGGAHTPIQWAAIAREAIIRSNCSPSMADAAIEQITGDARDVDEHHKQWAFDWIESHTALVEACEAAYAKLDSFEWPGRGTLEGQALLCQLRDSLALAKGGQL